MVLFFSLIAAIVFAIAINAPFVIQSVTIINMVHISMIYVYFRRFAF